MFRKKAFYVVLIMIVIAVSGIYWFTMEKKPRLKPEVVDGISLSAKASQTYLQVYKDGSWQNMLVKGVNMGLGKPGYFPGETAITKEEYLRWFEQIGAMNANTIRIYTLHPPAFYEALLEYNAKAQSPIYIMQGVWVDEDELAKTMDVYADSVSGEFLQEMHDIVDVIHGHAKIAERKGHASGAYKADISPYVLGWILGIEWDPNMVVSTNEKHQGTPDFSGTYFTSEHASPFEVWLAKNMDAITVYESENYQWQRPISFTNWVTTDLLKHPSEPSETEDLVSVNPNSIKANSSYHGGYFASYHVYPYYPEFLNYETKYTEYVDFRGQKNSYAGYLHDLKQAHQMPVLVAEFGVPASRGMTHRNVQGWNQGFHNETEQGTIDASLFEDIVHENMAGGLVFSWQDEWFKRTWNTMDLDNSDRRPFWSNVQTGEQHFGILSFDPAAAKHQILVDGQTKDWEEQKIDPVPVGDFTRAAASESTDEQQAIRQLYVTSDRSYVYVRLDFNKTAAPFDWSKVNAAILLDTIPDQGQHQIPGSADLTTEAGIDFVVDLKGKDQSRMWVDSYYDPQYYMYGQMLKMMPKLDYAQVKNNGVFHKIELTLNRPLRIPNVNGKTLELPLETYETGALRFGNGDPAAADFDSLTDVAVNEQEHIVELRIPWQLLQFRDPSTHEVMGDLWKDGIKASEKITDMKLALVTYDPQGGAAVKGPGGASPAYIYPGLHDQVLKTADMYRYTWEDWDIPEYSERLKKSYYTLQDLFGKTNLHP